MGLLNTYEYRAVMQAGRSAALCNVPLYIVHLSSEKGLNAVRKLRDEGVTIYVETTPHYLLLTEDKLTRDDGYNFLMTPPLREKSDNGALKKGLAAGEIDIVATDHCTYTPERKRSCNDCRDIPAGIPGSEEMASLLYSYFVADNSISIIRMGELLSRNPAKAFGLFPEKGSLEPGTDADIVLFSTKASGVFSSANVHTNAGYTAYEGLEFYGAPVMTILRGNIIFSDGKFLGKPGQGRFLKSRESSLYYK